MSEHGKQFRVQAMCRVLRFAQWLLPLAPVLRELAAREDRKLLVEIAQGVRGTLRQAPAGAAAV